MGTDTPLTWLNPIQSDISWEFEPSTRVTVAQLAGNAAACLLGILYGDPAAQIAKILSLGGLTSAMTRLMRNEINALPQISL